MQNPKQNGIQGKRLLLSCFLTVRGKYGAGKGQQCVGAAVSASDRGRAPPLRDAAFAQFESFRYKIAIRL